MTTKNRQIIYILIAFLALAVLHFIGVMVNLYLQNNHLNNILNSSALVINVTGVIIGVFNIYQALALRKATNLWVLFFIIGVVCVGFNAYSLSL
jgi:hypothetical protein